MVGDGDGGEVVLEVEAGGVCGGEDGGSGGLCNAGVAKAGGGKRSVRRDGLLVGAPAMDLGILESFKTKAAIIGLT